MNNGTERSLHRQFDQPRRGYRVDTDEVGDAVRAAIECDGPAVVDVAVDPAALYSFRRDSFTHRGG